MRNSDICINFFVTGIKSAASPAAHRYKGCCILKEVGVQMQNFVRIWLYSSFEFLAHVGDTKEKVGRRKIFLETVSWGGNCAVSPSSLPKVEVVLPFTSSPSREIQRHHLKSLGCAPLQFREEGTGS